MAAALGWIELSPRALRQLQRALENKGDEVRDELGDQAIQKGYANRLFPGTSVQHTRIRYLFFACWNYLHLAKRGRIDASNIGRHKQKIEGWVTRCLKYNGGEEAGVIGGRIYPKPTAIPPDAIYWTALREYGLYDGPSRAELLARWRSALVRPVGSATASEAPDDDVLARFYAPSVPEGWGKDESMALRLELEPSEADFLAKRIGSLDSCLLTEAVELARSRGPDPEDNQIWLDSLIAQASDRLNQHELIVRTGQVAQLVRIARCIYAALVEGIHLQTVPSEVRNAYGERFYQNSLHAVFSDEPWAVEQALGLDLSAMKADLDHRLPGHLLGLLEHVWACARAVHSTGGDIASRVEQHLLDPQTCEIFSNVERRRKGNRARLPRTPRGLERRYGLSPETINITALHYRWRIVKQMLVDLHRGLSR